MASRIEDYGLIGNTLTAALVSRSGSIDWLCAPRFDSDACFAALVGYDEHGRWGIRPTVRIRETRQRYRDDTLVLETEFVCDGGAVRIVDFMPIGGPMRRRPDHRRPRRRSADGDAARRPLRLRRRRAPHREDAPTGPASWPGRTRWCCAAPRAPRRSTGNRVSAYLNVKKGDRIPLQLTWFASHESPPPALDVDQALAATESFWRTWAARCTYQGRWREAVLRSLLTLKAMTYAPTGGIVAAPTTSLPECIGGVRNWDYRFCWLRDASLTLDAFMIGGYVDEARAFRDWLLRAIAGDPADMQIMYSIDGAPAAHRVRARLAAGLRRLEAGARRQRGLGPVPARRLRRGDGGDLRGRSGWASRERGAAGRAAKDADRLPRERLAAARRRHLGGARRAAALHPLQGHGVGRHRPAGQIHPGVRVRRRRGARDAAAPAARCASESTPRSATAGSTRRSARSPSRTAAEALDASVLVIPHYGFLPGTDPRVQGTVAAIEKELLRDGFVLRYGTEHGTDGLPGTEGAFLACSFWLADNYAFAGRIDEAEALFERLLGLRNHLGLLSEEYEPKLQRQIGNFPQAFSHLALILTARIIESAAQKRPLRRGDPRPGQRRHPLIV